MAYNIGDIVQSVGRNGVLPTNKFLVQFKTPKILQDTSISSILTDGKRTTDSERLISLRAEQARIPGITYMVSDVNRYGVGPMQKMPYNVSFTDTSVTFLADRRNQIYNYFYTWMNNIFDFSGLTNYGTVNSAPSYKAQYKDDYCVDLNIIVFDNNQRVVSEIIMKKAFPISLNDIPLDWNRQNDLMRITVGFTFMDWTVRDVTASTSYRDVTLPNMSQTPNNSTPQIGRGPR